MILATIVDVGLLFLGLSAIFSALLAIGMVVQYGQRKLFLSVVTDEWQSLEEIQVKIATLKKKRPPDLVDLGHQLDKFCPNDDTGIIRHRIDPHRRGNGRPMFGNFQYSLTARGRKLKNRPRRSVFSFSSK